MIVYFADRNLNIAGTASTELPKGIVILDDEKKEDIESGVRTFNVTFAYDDASHDLVQSSVVVGNFLLRSADDGNEFYTIITTEHNTEDQTVQAYAEDAGLDLLNTIAPELVNEDAHSLSYYANLYLPRGWEIGINELTGTRKLAWDGDSTVTERLLSIASEFSGELDFSYEIERLTVSKRYVNFYQHRGNRTPTHQLRLGYDIERITTNKSIEELATAFVVTGGTLSGKKQPINLKDFNYSSDGTNYHTPADPSDDFQIVGKQVRCLSAMNKWSSKLDSDGLLLRQYQYDTTSKLTLFKKSVTELKKVMDEATTYDISFITFPDDARLGDWVHVVDDKNNLYLQGRILELEKSITQNETKATLGEWIVKTSGIADRFQALENEMRKKALSATSISLRSTRGLIFTNESISTTVVASVQYGDEEITTQSRLEEVFGEDASVNWYSGSTQIGTGFTHVVTSANESVTISARVEDDD